MPSSETMDAGMAFLQKADSDLSSFVTPHAPGPDPMLTEWVSLHRLSAARDGANLFAAYRGDDSLWDYMFDGPFGSLQDFIEWVRAKQASQDPAFYAISKPGGAAIGQASLMRIDRSNGVIEIGHIVLSRHLQRNREGSAALMALIGWCFGAGYRRVEWKCNALNMPSRRAAIRLGFAFEGIFRQHMIVKNRNRDTAWFAMTDADWPALSRAYEAWLSRDNFDEADRQRVNLSDLTAAAMADRPVPD